MKPKAAPKGKDLKTTQAVAFQDDLNTMFDERARSIDELAIYDEMMTGVLEGVRNDLRKGLSAEDILTKYSAVAAARIVTIASTDADSGKALAAGKDILDRVQGKAKERKELTHKLERVDEKQIDALLLSELDAIEIEGRDVDDE